MTKSSLIALLAAAPFLIGTGSVTYAAGSSDASDTPTCEKGEIFDEKKEECVKDEKQSFNDDMLLKNAKALAYAKRFDEAGELLERIVDKNNAETQNYLGYVTRNRGDLDGGLAHYRNALTINPDYVLARSYMSQALLLDGQRRAAMIQLDEIEKRVGSEHPAYTQLAIALAQKSIQSNLVTY